MYNIKESGIEDCFICGKEIILDLEDLDKYSENTILQIKEKDTLDHTGSFNRPKYKLKEYKAET